MTTEIVERSPCIFCNIVSKLENTEIVFEDEQVCVFKDIKPAAKFHLLIVPKRHIESAKVLTPADKDLVARMVEVGKELLLKNNLSLESARTGFHWPPFISVKHLHMHVISPESEMGFISRLIFRKNSYWFVSTDYVKSLI